MVAQSSWTRASVASIFTGLLPQRHGTNKRDDVLSDEATTLAELLAGNGYQTAGFVTNGNVAPAFGLNQGFQSYELLLREGTDVLSDELNDHVFRWLDERKSEEPFFLYVHSVDPHSPYVPPKAYRLRFAAGVTDPQVGLMPMLRDLHAFRMPVTEQLTRQLLDLYDAEVAFNDHSFGKLVGELKRLGLYDSALILFVSDHGEEFYDHGWWEHGRTLYGEQLGVPLLIKFPRSWLGGRTTRVVAEHVDLLPTILDYSGIEEPEWIDGRSLLPYLHNAKDDGRLATSFLNLDNREIESVIFQRQKLIRNQKQTLAPRAAGFQFFDLADDAQERRNLAYERPVIVGYLKTLVRAQLQNPKNVLKAGRPAVLPAAVKEQLRALGYID
jgi:arylsulfatase A-like enzyme